MKGVWSTTLEHITPHGVRLIGRELRTSFVRLASVMVLVLDGGDIRWKRVCMGGAMVRWLSATQNLCLTVFVAPSSKFCTLHVNSFRPYFR